MATLILLLLQLPHLLVVHAVADVEVGDTVVEGMDAEEQFVEVEDAEEEEDAEEDVDVDVEQDVEEEDDDSQYLIF
jgi:hypothetical protein